MKTIITQIIILLFVIACFPVFLDAQKFMLHPYYLRVSFAISQTAVNDWKQGEVFTFEGNSSADFRKNLSIDFSENMKNDSLVFRFRFHFAKGFLFKKDKKNKNDYWIPTDNIFGSEGVLAYDEKLSYDTQYNQSLRFGIVVDRNN